MSRGVGGAADIGRQDLNSAALCHQIKASVKRWRVRPRCALLALARPLKLLAKLTIRIRFMLTAARKWSEQAVVAGALGLCLSLLANITAARAQSADQVRCDRIAADPSDPDKPAELKGVAEIAPSDIATAIKFCKRAAPSSRRVLYELGRAYAANRQMTEATDAYRKAADKGSSAAMVS